MDKSEPALVPEWLRGSSAGTNGGGSSLHHIASLSQSDDHSTSNSTRSKVHLSNGNNSTSRTSDRKSSHIRRSSSSNGAVLNEKVSSLQWQSYTSFSKSHRERDWDRDFDSRGKDRGALRSRFDFSDPLMLSTDVLACRDERDALRRSFSNISAKRGEVLSNKLVNDLNNKPHAAGSMLSPNNIKSTFERDFPSLGSEEKLGAPEVRVKSPGLSSASHSLPMNSATVIGGDGWTSVLAEVPIIIGGSSSVVLPTAASAPVSSAGMSLSSSTGLNMAEALVQASGRARMAPQSSVETHRLEELAIKQSRQLIPMTPSMPKSAALLSLDKSKFKCLRSNELSNTSKAGQQLSSSQLINHSLRGPSKSDSTKNSQPNSSFVILNRERSGYPTSLGDETLSPTHANAHSVTSPTATVAFSRSPTAVKLKSVGAKVTQISLADRKLTSQSHNRNEFFNSLRKKSSASNDHVLTTPDSTLSATEEKHEEDLVANSGFIVKDGKEVDFATGATLACSLSDGENAAIFSSDGEIPCSDEQAVVSSAIAFPDEEEEAFLKSLGWDAAAEEEALTEEEIQAFLEEYNKLTPTSKLCGQLNGINFRADMENSSCSSISNSNALKPP